MECESVSIAVEEESMLEITPSVTKIGYVGPLSCFLRAFCISCDRGFLVDVCCVFVSAFCDVKSCLLRI